MENFNFTMDLGFAPESLFETDQHIFGDGPITTNQSNLTKTSKNGSFNNSFEDFMDFDLDLSSESMSSFLELEQIPEVKPDPQMGRPSVIMTKPTQTMKAQPILTDIMSNCGIFKDLSEDFCNDSDSDIASPSSIHSDMELEKNQELIDELEEFFIKVDGSPTIVDEETEPVSLPLNSSPDDILSALTSGKVLENNNTLTMEDLNNAYTTSVVSEDGQNVIIIIAPNSPAEFDSFLEPVSPKSEFQPPISPTATITNDSDSSYDTDPEWSPSPASNTSFSTQILSPPEQTKHRKKICSFTAPTSTDWTLPSGEERTQKGSKPNCCFQIQGKEKIRTRHN